MEWDTKGDIDTDHYPVIGSSITNLRRNASGGAGRARYTKCNQEQNIELNSKLENTMPSNLQEGGAFKNIKEWLCSDTKELPKHKTKDKHKNNIMSIRFIQLLADKGGARKKRPS